MVRIATFNVNGVNGRLPVLLKWLAATNYDIVCLQELKTSDEKFPTEAIREAGYSAIWHGQKSYNGVAILSRGASPVERRRGLPGDPDDTHSRCIEADVNGLIVGCLYLPNGNPVPGSKFDYKLRRASSLGAQLSNAHDRMVATVYSHHWGTLHGTHTVNRDRKFSGDQGAYMGSVRRNQLPYRPR
ncbi:exodeoxyribonuclease III [Mesorhizobium sp.]|uniref:exodeoxyribonuclease III n=1 Tax=Mesorhizobium sp. TaxID=1871066 RepID=UPI00257AA634|nr:exodeoxyribonuclease III [Mesorhizobium sp.]